MINKNRKYTEDGLPIIGPKYPEHPKKAPDEAVAVCGQCGLRIYKIMHYSCPQPNCPVFLQASCIKKEKT